MFIDSRGKRRLILVAAVVAIGSLLLAVLTSLVTALGASAHTALVSMSPAAGSTSRSAPAAVRLVFTEPVSSSFVTVTVTGPGGRSVVSGRPVVASGTVTQQLVPDLVSGAYSVTYRVVSKDGHPVSDRAAFTLALPAAPSATATAAPSTAPSTAIDQPSTPADTTTTTAAATDVAAAPSDGGDGDGLLQGRGLWLGLGIAVALVLSGVGMVAADRRSKQA